MELRHLTATDTAQCVALWEACGLTRPWNDPAGDLARALAGPSSTVLGAVEADRLIGTVMVGHDGHRGWVYYLAVDADRRGTGVGRTLMAKAEHWLGEQGVPKVQLMVRTSNAAVVDFYQRLGYSDQGCVVLGRFLDEELEARRRAGSS